MPQRLDSLLDKLGSHYCQTLSPEKSGSLFKFEKQGEHFVHTEMIGNLLRKVVGKTLYEVLPIEVAERKNAAYQKAWEGNEVAYRGISSKGCEYIVYLVPHFIDGRVVEVYGHGIDMSKWDMKHLIITLTDRNGVVKFVSENAVEYSKGKIEDMLDKKIDLHDGERVDEVRRIIFETKRPYHMIIRLTLNGIKFSLLSIGVPILHNDDVVCMLSFSEIISKCPD